MTPSAAGAINRQPRVLFSLCLRCGHPENLPRTRRDHAGATRQELARFDREDGLRRRIKAFAGVLLEQIPYFCAPFGANTANRCKPGIQVIPCFSCIYNGLRCFLRVRCTAHACMEKHARAHLSTHFYERICTRYEWCRQAPPAAHTCRQLAPRTTSGDTVRAEFGLGLESAQHPIGPTEEVAVLHRFAWLHILE